MTKENMSYFLLRWSDHISNYSEMFMTLREEEEFLDCTIACQDGEVGAHKLVLAGCSSYLRGLLKRSNNPHPVILLIDIPRSTVLLLMQFIYRGQVQVPHHRLHDLIRLGQAMQIKGISQIELPQKYAPVQPRIPRMHGSPNRFISEEETVEMRSITSENYPTERNGESVPSSAEKENSDKDGNLMAFSAPGSSRAVNRDIFIGRGGKGIERNTPDPKKLTHGEEEDVQQERTSGEEKDVQQERTSGEEKDVQQERTSGEEKDVQQERTPGEEKDVQQERTPGEEKDVQQERTPGEEEDMQQENGTFTAKEKENKSDNDCLGKKDSTSTKSDSKMLGDLEKTSRDNTPVKRKISSPTRPLSKRCSARAEELHSSPKRFLRSPVARSTPFRIENSIVLQASGSAKRQKKRSPYRSKKNHLAFGKYAVEHGAEALRNYAMVEFGVKPQKRFIKRVIKLYEDSMRHKQDCKMRNSPKIS